MHKNEAQGVAVTTHDSDRRIISRTVIQCVHAEQAEELFMAVNKTANLRAALVYRSVDCFGKLVWLEC